MRLLGDSNASAVTTMFDYYGQLNDFPGRKDVRGKNCYDKVKKVEEAFGNDIDNSNFIPYLQLHEFEGLLFSSPEVIADNLIKPGKREHRELLKELQKIRNQVTTPEEINDNKKTCPSKRICKLAQKYQKINDGIPIAKKIGLEKIRKECPHFNEWLEKIEKLS